MLDRIPAGRRVSIERATFPEMVADGSLFALHSDAYWIDAGTPATYLQAQLDLDRRSSGPSRAGGAPRRAVVERGAAVEHAVVMAGAVVEAGAVVRDSARAARRRASGATAGSRAPSSGPGPSSAPAPCCVGSSVIGDDVAVEAGRRARRAPGCPTRRLA